MKRLRSVAGAAALRSACQEVLEVGETAELVGELRAAAVRAEHRPYVGAVCTGAQGDPRDGWLISAVVADLLASAATEILLVGYAVHSEPVVEHGLVAAVGRGVEVTLVLERHADNPSFSGPGRSLSGLSRCVSDPARSVAGMAEPAPVLQQLRADLVCEGGGVKGIALAGAVSRLAAAGYAFPRAAGSSAGAVVACLVAALQAAGEPLARLDELVATVDYRRFRDRGGLGRLPLVGPALQLLLHEGVYEGAYLQKFLEDALGELGVRTFGDLRASAALELPPDRDWRLVVTVSDLSRRRLVRLPWDLPDYGLEPDDYPVAKAVRASSAIPFVFRPVRQDAGSLGAATWVDGGLLSNFPVGLFDRADSLAPRWPTFGVRLSRPPESPPVLHPVRGPVELGVAALDALLTDQGAAYAAEPCTAVRTIAVPTSGISVTDFDLSTAERDRLWTSGRDAAAGFLQNWDFAAYTAACRNGLPLPGD